MIRQSELRAGTQASMNWDTDKASHDAGLDCDLDNEPSLTHQSFKEECDINEIVRRFGLTGELPNDYTPPVSGDFTNVTDFQSAMNAVRAAEEQFMLVPAHIRERFNNDPQRLIEFLENDANRAEALTLGLLQPPPEQTRDAVQAIDELRTALTTQKT